MTYDIICYFVTEVSKEDCWVCSF